MAGCGLPGLASIYSLKWWIVDGHGYEQCGCWHDLIKTAECGEEMQGAEAECLFSILTLITCEEKLQLPFRSTQQHQDKVRPLELVKHKNNSYEFSDL